MRRKRIPRKKEGQNNEREEKLSFQLFRLIRRSTAESRRGKTQRTQRKKREEGGLRACLKCCNQPQLMSVILYITTNYAIYTG
jgi:hypothetical protein